VSADFDLNLLSLYRVKGQEMPQNPGLLAVTPPRRTARGRKNETLLIYLTLFGKTRFTSAEYENFIFKTKQRFFETTGSLTSAIRNAADLLNQFLLNRNLHTTGKGEYIVGRLIMGVLRESQFVFAQCGPTSVIHLTGIEARQIHDDQIAGRGLGISQLTPLYFARIDLHPDDLLVLFSNPTTGWEPMLSGGKNISFETLRRKIWSISSDDLNVVLVRAKTGKGHLNILKGMQSTGGKPVAVAPSIITDATEGSPKTHHGTRQTGSPVDDIDNSVHATPTSQVDSSQPASHFARILSEGEKSAQPANLSNSEEQPHNTESPAAPARHHDRTAAGPPFERSVAVPAAPVSRPVRHMGRFVSPRLTGDIPNIKRPASRQRRAIFGGLARIIQKLRAGSRHVTNGFGKLIPKILPNSRDGSEVVGPSMALFSIVIPVIIVAIAATVYFHYGRTAQYQQYYAMALAQASQARDQKNPTEVRRAWDSSIYYLDLAENNQKTQDSNTLRQEAQTALDNLDGILRLDFRPAISGGLSQTTQISHIAATDTDLFLLDSSRGSVMRASMTTQGYQVDPSFKCDPGQHGTINVEALLDMKTLPRSNLYNARLLAMDGKGNLLYCGLSDPVAVSITPPQLGWRNISAFSLNSNGDHLYVLDPGGNAVWLYTTREGKFQDPPNIFFGEQVPQNMTNAIDLALNEADLYVLFQDGHVTSCPLSLYADVPMRCADPATFVDARPERQAGPKIYDAIFTQITFASDPDPSLYLLEPLTRAIYRFSPRSDSLELRGQFRATMEQNNSLFNGPATSMAIGTNRYAFFSVGNQVYFASDVP
jgi:hypothetical protein